MENIVDKKLRNAPRGPRIFPLHRSKGLSSANLQAKHARIKKWQNHCYCNSEQIRSRRERSYVDIRIAKRNVCQFLVIEVNPLANDSLQHHFKALSSCAKILRDLDLRGYQYSLRNSNVTSLQNSKAIIDRD